jgi:HTH-type transcriptional regulator / antitoxin HipB
MLSYVDICPSKEAAMRQVRTVVDLGVVVRAARRRANWTQAELAERAGVSRQWVVALESGQAARAELGRVLSVLAALDLPMTFPDLASKDQSTDSRPRRIVAPNRAAKRRTPMSPEPDDVQDRPWLDLDSHLASFTANRRPGTDHELEP